MEEENVIIGYHGTTTDSALSIIDTYRYNKSNNEDDWLGSGIYFYDTLDNAILYNIRKYKNSKKSYPKYEELKTDRKILVNKIVCKKNEIVDFNNFENLQKFLGLWKIFYDKVKNDENFKRLNLQDGYMINWLYNETQYFEGCKIFKNIFMLDIRFNRKINKIFNDKTRIGYKINQVFMCVVDDSCIKEIQLYENDYRKNYEIIKDITNNILMKKGGNDEIL